LLFTQTVQQGDATQHSAIFILQNGAGAFQCITEQMYLTLILFDNYLMIQNNGVDNFLYKSTIDDVALTWCNFLHQM
jgi:hypothetical protein